MNAIAPKQHKTAYMREILFLIAFIDMIRNSRRKKNESFFENLSRE